MPKASLTHIASLLIATVRLLSEREGSVAGIEPYSHVRFEALSFVAEKKQPTMKDLAKHFAVTPPSATALVEQLVKDKELTRSADPKDRRIVRLSITTKGQVTLKKGFAKKLERIKLTFAPLSAEEREEMARMLRKIAIYYQTN